MISKFEIPKLDLKGEIILIVEDEFINLELLKIFILETGARVLEAINGQAAVEMVKKNKNIALILMDVRMPKMDGYEATKKIKEIASNIPIIIQTAYSTDKDKRKAKEAGADSYLLKPINKMGLFEEIKRCLKEKRK